MIEKIGIEEFLELAKRHVVLDVRSPGEYLHACIPGAYSLPLFSDAERKIVGTAYKQQGREEAIKIGLDFFGVKMTNMVVEVEKLAKSGNQTQNSAFEVGGQPADIIPNSQKSIPVLVHCWRGGMRSAGVAWLLDLYGFKVYVLDGGYKAFRNWVLQQFEVPYPFKVLGGYTGSGKTEVLQQLASKGESVVDLEGIACHRGSAFGSLGQPKQPSQEMFENNLAFALSSIHNTVPESGNIWVEDESRRIGDVNLPGALWNTIRRSPLHFLEIPFEQRLNFIVQQYGVFDKASLMNSIMRIQRRLGGVDTKKAIEFLADGNLPECFRILLRYYDKFYAKDIVNRGKLFLLSPGKSVSTAPQSRSIPFVVKQQNAQFPLPLVVKKIICETVDANVNSEKLG